MHLDPYTSISDAANLISAVEALDVTVPKRLKNLIAAHETLSARPSAPDPAAAILDAAEAGGLTEAKIAKMCSDAVAASAITEFRTSLAQKASRKFLQRIYNGLQEGDGDLIIGGLRPAFDAAAQAMTE